MAFPSFYLLGYLFAEARATVTGTTIKDVRCESCGFEYVYQLSRTAQGRSTSFLVPDHATIEARARANLRQELKNSCDPVPCGVCGWYQRAMVQRARQLKYRRLLVAGGLLCFLAILLCAQASIAWSIAEPADFPIAAALSGAAGTALMLGLGLPVLRLALCQLYDPNTEDVESRKARGRERALNKEAFVSGFALPPPPGARWET